MAWLVPAPEVLAIDWRFPPLVVAMVAENECVPLAHLNP